MPLWLNATLQILLLACQCVNPIADADILTVGQRMLVATFIAFLQGSVAIVAHFYNPNGTSYKAPGDPK